MRKINIEAFTCLEKKLLWKALVAELEMSQAEQAELLRVKNRAGVMRKQKDIDACVVLVSAFFGEVVK